MSDMHLNPKLFHPEVEQEPIRAGFGRGLLEAGQRDDRVVALCADLTDSTKMDLFAKQFPERFVEMGVAEQNLVTVGAGMALAGKVPFVSSYAAFSPGRNWEQIRTTVCLNEANVKIVGSHAGVSVGPDGATHQMLEDIALMRVLPHMRVVVPCDSVEAEKATLALAASHGPAYIRLAREKTPVITTKDTPFDLNKAQVLREGGDVTIIACGTMVYQALRAAKELEEHGLEAEVINAAVIKPFDTETVLRSVKKTGAIVTAEEGQVAGGLGGLVAEVLAENHPAPLERIGMLDRFGESGQPDELLEHFGLTSKHIVKAAKQAMNRKPVAPLAHRPKTNQEKARELWARTRTEKFAVGAFNVDNQETLVAIARAAKAKNAPVLVEVSQGEVDAIGLANMRDLVDNYKVEYGVEMYINLDHSPSVEAAKAGIDAGFEFIHIDVSQADHDATNEEIIAATREVVEYAKKTGALVESEPHYFGGSSNVHKEDIDYDEVRKTFSTPEGAKAFVDATGIDTFAAAIGNLHGKYPVPKKLDIALLKKIRPELGCAISLHGGSDTPAHYFKEAVAVGVSKVNINSDMRYAYRTELEEQLDENPDEYAVVKLEGAVIDAVQKVVEEHIDMFGSVGKAKP